VGAVERLTDQDFEQFIISAQVVKDDGGGYHFAPVASEKFDLKIIAAYGIVQNFIVHPDQLGWTPATTTFINIEKKKDLPELVEYIRGHNVAGEKFRERAIEEFESRFPDGNYPELVLTPLPDILSVMSPVAWQQILSEVQNSYTRSLFEYLLKPSSEQRSVARMVVFGDPGIGKSDLLKYVGYVCAKNHSFVPLYIDFSACKHHDFNSLIAEQAKLIDKKANIDALLERRDFLLLLDGLDSVGSQSELGKGIQIFSRLHNQCHIIISCDVQNGNSYLAITENYTLTLINGLSLATQFKMVEELSDDQRGLFKSLRHDAGIAQLCANPAFLVPFIEVINQCDNLRALQTKWSQMEVLFSIALSAQGGFYPSEKLQRELVNLAERKLIRVFPRLPGIQNSAGDKNNLRILADAKILIRSQEDNDDYRFSAPSFLAFFAAKSLLKNENALIDFLKTPLSQLADDPTSRELLVFLHVNGKIPREMLENLLDLEQDDVYLHRSALAIKCLQQKKEFSIPASNFEAAAEKVISLWKTSGFPIQSDFLFEAIVNIKLHAPNLIEKNIFGETGEFDAISQELFEHYSNGPGRINLPKSPDPTNSRDTFKVLESLRWIKDFNITLDTNGQKRLLEYLSTWTLEFNALAVLLTTTLTKNSRLEAIRLLVEKLQKPVQRNINEIIQELQMVCEVLGNLGFSTAQAQQEILKIFSKEISESRDSTQAFPWDTWLVIELAKYYDLDQFERECREKILEVLKNPPRTGQLEGYVKDAASLMFKKTCNYEIRKQLAQVIWSDTSEKEPIVEPGTTEPSYLVEEIVTRIDVVGEEILLEKIKAILEKSTSEAKTLTEKLILTFFYGNAITRRRILTIFSGVRIKSIGDEPMERLKTLIIETHSKRKDATDFIWLYSVLIEKVVDDTPTGVLQVVNEILSKKCKEDPVNLESEENANCDELVAIAKNITLALERNARFEPILIDIVKQIVEYEGAKHVISPFTHQLDKAGFRFSILTKNGIQEISTEYNDFRRITLNI